MGGLLPNIDNEVFRKDFPLVIARNRHLASIVPVVLANVALGYAAGTVLGRNSVSGEYMPYDDSGASGEDTAVGVLFNTVDAMSAGTVAGGQMIVRGELFEANLTGLDANGKVDLKSRSVVSGSGDTILIF
jgi:hypothetical protein